MRAELARGTPLETYRKLTAENDARIRGAELGNGRDIVEERTAIHTELVAAWARQVHGRLGYDKPFAVVALGGTGRGEVTPASDLDFAFLFDDALEGNWFLAELQRQILNGEFEEAHGFTFEPFPFNLDDAPRLDPKQLNAFLDLRPVFDPSGLAARFRERVRSTYDSFEHFLHVRSFWKDQWEKAAAEVERLDRFDIKHNALRVFLAGIWTLAGKRFTHSWDVYESLEDPRDLEAYYFLLRVRCFVHVRRNARGGRGGNGGNHPEDSWRFEDFLSFGEMLGPDADERARFDFGNEVRARLLAARRRVARFSKAVIERELRKGRPAGAGSRIVYGVGGLYHAASHECRTPEEKSRAALSLLLASQRYGVPIDPAELERTFRHIEDWLEPVPELGALFYEQRGSLAESFAFLAQFEGAEDRLFPGYARFEASVDERVMTEREFLRGALERRKLRTLEETVRAGREKISKAIVPAKLMDPGRIVDVAVESALLDADHLAAVKLALKTKRLPLTPEDIRLRQDESLGRYDRFSSGMSDISLAEYYLPYLERCGFSEETIRTTESLIALRRAFKDRAHTPNDEAQVREFGRVCGDEQFMRALFVFTCVDRAEWHSAVDDPVRWFNSRELYSKTLRDYFGQPEAPAARIRMLGCGDEEARMLEDFGEAFWGGEYRQYANVFASSLRRLHDEPETGGSKVVLLPAGTCPLIGVAARDYRGLAACITGALWAHGMDLRQAHLFSAMHFGLALDFFHIKPGANPPGRELLQGIQESIRHRRHIDDGDEAALPRLEGRTTLIEWRPREYRLRYEVRQDVGGLVYALCYKLFRHLGANIYGLVSHAGRAATYVSIYHSLPEGLSLSEAQRIVDERFR